MPSDDPPWLGSTEVPDDDEPDEPESGDGFDSVGAEDGVLDAVEPEVELDEPELVPVDAVFAGVPVRSAPDTTPVTARLVAPTAVVSQTATLFPADRVLMSSTSLSKS